MPKRSGKTGVLLEARNLTEISPGKVGNLGSIVGKVHNERLGHGVQVARNRLPVILIVAAILGQVSCGKQMTWFAISTARDMLQLGATGHWLQETYVRQLALTATLWSGAEARLGLVNENSIEW